MIELYCIKENKTYDISNMVKSITWKGSKYNAPRSLEVNLINNSHPSNSLIEFEEGNALVFKWKGRELHRGIIFKINKDVCGAETLVSHDQLIYMLKNKDSYVFENKKASEIITRICKDFEIPIGDIVDTGYVIPNQVFDSKKLYDIVMTSLDTTRKQTGVRHYLFSEKGKIYLKRRKDMTRKWAVEHGVNLIDYSFSTSIEDTATKVLLKSGQKGKEITAPSENKELQKKFGVLQHYEKISEKINKAQLQQRADEILNKKGKINKEFSLNALGISEVISGTSIYVIEKDIGIKKGFYVEEDTHNFNGNKHTMSLKLSETDDLYEVK